MTPKVLDYIITNNLELDQFRICWLHDDLELAKILWKHEIFPERYKIKQFIEKGLHEHLKLLHESSDGLISIANQNPRGFVYVTKDIKYLFELPYVETEDQMKCIKYIESLNLSFE